MAGRQGGSEGVNARNVVLYLGGAVVMLAVIGAIYLEIVVQSRSTHDVWMATQDVAAGAPFTTDNVRQVSVPDTGDSLSYYHGNPVADRKRAGRTLRGGHMLAFAIFLDGPSNEASIQLLSRMVGPIARY